MLCFYRQTIVVRYYMEIEREEEWMWLKLHVEGLERSLSTYGSYLPLVCNIIWMWLKWSYSLDWKSTIKWNLPLVFLPNFLSSSFLFPMVLLFLFFNTFWVLVWLLYHMYFNLIFVFKWILETIRFRFYLRLILHNILSYM